MALFNKLNVAARLTITACFLFSFVMFVPFRSAFSIGRSITNDDATFTRLGSPFFEANVCPLDELSNRLIDYHHDGCLAIKKSRSHSWSSAVPRFQFTKTVRPSSTSWLTNLFPSSLRLPAIFQVTLKVPKAVCCPKEQDTYAAIFPTAKTFQFSKTLRHPTIRAAVVQPLLCTPTMLLSTATTFDDLKTIDVEEKRTWFGLDAMTASARASMTVVYDSIRVHRVLGGSIRSLINQMCSTTSSFLISMNMEENPRFSFGAMSTANIMSLSADVCGGIHNVLQRGAALTYGYPFALKLPPVVLTLASVPDAVTMLLSWSEAVVTNAVGLLSPSAAWYLPVGSQPPVSNMAVPINVTLPHVTSSNTKQSKTKQLESEVMGPAPPPMFRQLDSLPTQSNVKQHEFRIVTFVNVGPVPPPMVQYSRSFPASERTTVADIHDTMQNILDRVNDICSSLQTYIYHMMDGVRHNLSQMRHNVTSFATAIDEIRSYFGGHPEANRSYERVVQNILLSAFG